MPYITHPFYTVTYNQCDRQTARQTGLGVQGIRPWQY